MLNKVKSSLKKGFVKKTSICVFLGLLGQIVPLPQLQAESVSRSSKIHIGVIDQIDFPWMTFASESGHLFSIHLPSLAPQIHVQEGQWIIYCPATSQHKTRIYPLDPQGIKNFRKDLNDSLNERLHKLKQRPLHSDPSLF